MGTGAAAHETRASTTTSERKLTSHNTSNNNNGTYIIYIMQHPTDQSTSVASRRGRRRRRRISLKTAIFHTGFAARRHSRPKREETSSRLYLLALVRRSISTRSPSTRAIIPAEFACGLSLITCRMNNRRYIF